MFADDRDVIFALRDEAVRNRLAGAGRRVSATDAAAEQAQNGNYAGKDAARHGTSLLRRSEQAQGEVTKLFDGRRINAILAQSMGNGVSHMHVAHQ